MSENASFGALAPSSLRRNRALKSRPGGVCIVSPTTVPRPTQRSLPTKVRPTSCLLFTHCLDICMYTPHPPPPPPPPLSPADRHRPRHARAHRKRLSFLSHRAPRTPSSQQRIHHNKADRWRERGRKEVSRAVGLLISHKCFYNLTLHTITITDNTCSEYVCSK